MIQVPSGIFDLTATAQTYAPTTAHGLAVYDSDVTWHDFEIMPLGAYGPIAPDDAGDGSEAPADSDSQNDDDNGEDTFKAKDSGGSNGGGDSCFISTLAIDPPDFPKIDSWQR